MLAAAPEGILSLAFPMSKNIADFADAMESEIAFYCTAGTCSRVIESTFHSKRRPVHATTLRGYEHVHVVSITSSKGQSKVTYLLVTIFKVATHMSESFDNTRVGIFIA